MYCTVLYTVHGTVHPRLTNQSVQEQARGWGATRRARFRVTLASILVSLLTARARAAAAIAHPSSIELRALTLPQRARRSPRPHRPPAPPQVRGTATDESCCRRRLRGSWRPEVPEARHSLLICLNAATCAPDSAAGATTFDKPLYTPRWAWRRVEGGGCAGLNMGASWWTKPQHDQLRPSDQDERQKPGGHQARTSTTAPFPVPWASGWAAPALDESLAMAASPPPFLLLLGYLGLNISNFLLHNPLVFCAHLINMSPEVYTPSARKVEASFFRRILIPQRVSD